MSTTLRAASGSSAENLFISLFEDVFGAEKTGYLYSQYPFFDIYQDSRFADFLLENGGRRVAIEIDDDASHLPGHVSQVKHYDDLTKQNSMIHMGWGVYRWPVRVIMWVLMKYSRSHLNNPDKSSKLSSIIWSLVRSKDLTRRCPQRPA